MRMVVVKPYSGAIDMDALIEDMTADHLSITKPADRQSLRYANLLAFAVSRAAPSKVRHRSPCLVLVSIAPFDVLVPAATNVSVSCWIQELSMGNCCLLVLFNLYCYPVSGICTAVLSGDYVMRSSQLLWVCSKIHSCDA